MTPQESHEATRRVRVQRRLQRHFRDPLLPLPSPPPNPDHPYQVEIGTTSYLKGLWLEIDFI